MKTRCWFIGAKGAEKELEKKWQRCRTLYTNIWDGFSPDGGVKESSSVSLKIN